MSDQDLERDIKEQFAQFMNSEPELRKQCFAAYLEENPELRQALFDDWMAETSGVRGRSQASKKEAG